MKLDIFHHLLYDVYGESVAEDILKAYAKDIMNVADRYSPHRQLASSCSTQSGVIDFLADNGKDMIGKIRHSDDVPGPKEQVK